MSTTIPSSLDSRALARRLGELVGDERNVQVDFLLHLDEFDRRRAYVEAGFSSLWDYCLRDLHLREGAAGRRIAAMRVLRRFPRLEAALRDGRLCLSTAPLLGQVLTDENLDELLARAAHLTKTEVEHLVVSLQPRAAPKEGIRKLPGQQVSAAAQSAAREDHTAAPALAAAALALAVPAVEAAPAQPVERVRPLPASVEAPRPSATEVRPVSEDAWSVRVTIDSSTRAELETLKALLSHKIPSGDLSAVLREAIRCGIEKHGNRKGASAPAQQRPARSVTTSAHVPAAVRRDVWKRDGGCCTFVGPDGRRCGSRWQLELDHITPVALGGASTADNLRVRCRPHNLLHAERVYGRDHMDQFRTAPVTIAGDSTWSARVGVRREHQTEPPPEATSRAVARRKRGRAPDLAAGRPSKTGADTQT